MPLAVRRDKRWYRRTVAGYGKGRDAVVIAVVLSAFDRGRDS
jgi:hypothetical protein